jgi:hypothetical protein
MSEQHWWNDNWQEKPEVLIVKPVPGNAIQQLNA